MRSEIEWIRGIPALRRASPAFFDYLRQFRFTGEVWAIAEGTPFFPYEPVLRVTAPLAEAQLLETALLAIVNFQISIASKAARIVGAANGRPVMEFGARRAHGLDAALYAARAAHVGGCDSTSFVGSGARVRHSAFRNDGSLVGAGGEHRNWMLSAATSRTSAS